MMRPLKSVSRFATSEKHGCSIYSPFFFGVPFFFVGVGLLIRDGVYFDGGYDFGFLFFAVIGAWMILGGIVEVTASLRFGQPQAWISELVTRPGDTLHFFFEQPCRQNTEVNSVDVFLVFRERVDFYEISETVTKEVDRLVQKLEFAGRVHSAGETIRCECVFRIPERNMGIRNAYMGEKNAKVETFWVVKVRINLAKSRDVWKEYSVEVTGDPYAQNSSAQEERVDVILLKRPPSLSLIRNWKSIDLVVPHIGMSELFVAGHPLLERLTPEQGEHVRSQLEKANVQVEIRPSV